MGKRGPKPLPREVLAQRGSRNGRASGNPPLVDRSRPDPPDWLDETARACWEQIAPQLDEMGCLARIDAHALARYCGLWSRWRKAEEFIAKYGETYPLKDGSGNIKYFAQFPQVAIAHRLSLALTKIEAEFGMTPSSRSRIEVVPNAGPQNAILDFLASQGD